MEEPQQSNSQFALPALKSLGQLAGTQPVILVDSRELTPLPFSRLKFKTATLITGDYSALGMEELISIERKTIPDLIGCCQGANRERFERYPGTVNPAFIDEVLEKLLE